MTLIGTRKKKCAFCFNIPHFYAAIGQHFLKYSSGRVHRWFIYYAPFAPGAMLGVERHATLEFLHEGPCSTYLGAL
ncbi:hypothetical protein TorRG33x02_319720 [Trema orientale]|uniref:Uncharacterized protein n=1 Tax=Trema orientale TaxID=63057 RepID=A0A2P5BIG0_TREOI|nr:hypothetical protein TorRG33x02_319720 [Trema orientale]